MTTPYVTPEMIQNAPTGISWSIIPFPQSTSQQQYAEQYNMCERATGMVNAYCNQTLRASVETEQVTGPDYYTTMQQDTGNARVILSQRPVTEILQVAVTANALPWSWTTMPSQFYGIDVPVLGVYGTSAPGSAGNGGQTILLGGQYLSWLYGRNGARASVTYVSGWPHASLTSPANIGDEVLQVDDVTGFGVTDVAGWTGASARVYDGADTEVVTATSTNATVPGILPFGGTAQTGAGTISLSAPLLYGHATGTLVSSLPQNILWATILATMVQALESGITAVTIQNIPGSETVGGQGILALMTEYQDELKPYRRVI